MATERKHGDKKMTYLVCGFFTAALLFIDFKYGRWSEMSGWILTGIILLHAFLAYTCYQVVVTMDDPNNRWRVTNIVMIFVCIAAVMFHRADRVGTEMFWDDVDKNKTENPAP